MLPLLSDHVRAPHHEYDLDLQATQWGTFLLQGCEHDDHEHDDDQTEDLVRVHHHVLGLDSV